jgi:methyl farnesoate epoxidase/farnesoate epoxidase
MQLGYHHLVYANLSTKYGPVAGLRLGRDRIVIVSGYDAVRDVLLREEFDGRPDGFFFRLRTFGKRLGNAEKQFLVTTLYRVTITNYYFCVLPEK